MGRGPSYPYVALEEAVALTRKMYDYARRAAAPVEAISSEAWKYSPTSSSGQKVLAALRAFGLVEDAPGSNGKSLKISPRAVRILLDDSNSKERQEELKRSALSPKWYEFCWRTWGKEMPSSMRSILLVEHGFVESTIDTFLKDYRKTAAFAGLLDSAPTALTAESSHESKATPPNLGDYVQWESQGVLRMPEARKLTHFSKDGDFAFVEGSVAAIPTAELIQAEMPEASRPLTSNMSPHQSVLWANTGTTLLQETFSLPDGSFVSIQWPTSFTAEAFQDFADWLAIVQRKIRRTVTSTRVVGVENSQGPEEKPRAAPD